jgi:hypothetical protein
MAGGVNVMHRGLVETPLPPYRLSSKSLPEAVKVVGCQFFFLAVCVGSDLYTLANPSAPSSSGVLSREEERAHRQSFLG